MNTQQAPSIFYVHRTYKEGDNIQKFIRELQPHNGHQSYDDAKQWINDHAESHDEYVILEVFKKP